MGNDTFRLSRETKKALGEHSDFFESIGKLNQELNLSLKGRDLEAHTEAETASGGDRVVTFVYPLDDNDLPGDGRIYLKDKFVFDAGETRLKSYQRAFELHPSVQANPKWQDWLKKFQATVTPLDAGDDKLQKFAFRVALTYSRSITAEIKGALRSQAAYLTVAGEDAQDVDPAWRLKIGDPQAHFSTDRKGDELVITLTVPVDADADPKNGRIFFSDQFILNAKDRKLKSFQRSWSVAPEVDEPKKTALGRAVAKLNAGKAPKNEDAERFLAALLPVLAPAPSAPADPFAPLPENKIFPPDSDFAFTRYRKGQDGAKQAGHRSLQDSLPLAKALALDILDRKHDAAQAWLSGKERFDLAKHKTLIEGIFQKAAEAQKESGGTSDLKEALHKLALSDEEKKALAAVEGDVLFQRFAALVGERDGVLRRHHLQVFAREELLKKGYGASAGALAAHLNEHDDSKSEAGKILAFLQGGGGLGTKAEYLVPAFVEQTSKPSMLLAMAGSGFIGPMAELGGLKLIHRLGGAVGPVGRFGAGIAGIAGEATAFTALHKIGDSFSQNPDKVWAHPGGEIVSGMLLFGAMRLSHAGTGWATARMAEGRFGTVFGGRMPSSLEGAPLPANWVTPSGRVSMHNVWGGAGTAPALTRLGHRTSGLINHGAAIGAMGLTSFIGQKIGLHPANDQTMGGHLFDATVMYTQAMVGFRLMNGLTGGRIQPELAEIRLRTHQQMRDLTQDPNAKVPKWELAFAAAQKKSAERGTALFERGGEKFPRLARGRETLESLVQARDLSEARIEKILTDMKTPDSEKPSVLSGIWKGAGIYFGKFAARLDGMGIPAKGVIEFFSLWRLANQRALKEKIEGLKGQLQERAEEKDAALRTAAEYQAEVDRLQEILDHQIEEELPTLIKDFEAGSSPETKQAQKSQVKAKIEELSAKRDEAERNHSEALRAIEEKRQEIETLQRNLEAAVARGQDRDVLAEEVKVLTSDLRSLETQDAGNQRAIQKLKDQLEAEKRAGTELSGQLVVKDTANEEMRDANADLNRQVREWNARHAEAVETARLKGEEIERLNAELAQARAEIENYEMPVLQNESDAVSLEWAAPGLAVNSEIALSRGIAAEALVKNLRDQTLAKVGEIEALETQMEWEKAKDNPDNSQLQQMQLNHRRAVEEANGLVVRLEQAKKVAAVTMIVYLRHKVQEEEGKGADLLARLAAGERAVAEVSALLETSRREAGELDRVLRETMAKLEIKTEELRQAGENIGILSGQVEARERELTEHAETIRGLNETIQGLEVERAGLIDDIALRDAEIARLNGEVDKAREEAQIAKDTAELLTTDREEALQAEVDRLTRVLETTNFEKGKLEGELETKGMELEREKGKLARATARAEEAEGLLEKANSSLEVERGRYASLDREHKELMGEAERADERYVRESMDKDREIQGLNDSLREKEKELATAIAETEALRGPAGRVSDLELRIQELLDETKEGERLRRELDGKVLNEERRANQLDDDLTSARVEIEEVARERDHEKSAKEEAQAQAAANAERAQQNYDAWEILDREVRQLKLDLQDARDELTAIKAFPPEKTVQHTPQDVALAGRIQELEQKLQELTQDNTELTNDNAFLLGEVERINKDLLDLRNASETVLGETLQERRAVEEKAEKVQDSRNVHKIKAEALETRVEELETQVSQFAARVADLTERNHRLKELFAAREANTTYLHFFNNLDPRKVKSVIPFQAESVLTHRDSNIVVGKAHIIAGGAQGTIRKTLANGTIISMKTSVGQGRKVQEDSIYLAVIVYPFEVPVPEGGVLPAGTEIVVQGVADGAGGEGGGNVASSAWLQGIHARVAEIVYHGRLPDAKDLFEQGAVAVEKQKEEYQTPPRATGAGMVLVQFGDRGTVATGGDVPLIWQRKLPNGSYEVHRITNIDLRDEKNKITQFISQMPDEDGQKMPQFSAWKFEGMRKSDRLYSPSDGGGENIDGDNYKFYGSAFLRLQRSLPHPNQRVWTNLNLTAEVLEGREDAGELLHDLAVENMKDPGKDRDFFGVKLQMPPKDLDNATFTSIEIGDVKPVSVTLPDYQDLEFVFDMESTLKMEAAAAAKQQEAVEIPEAEIEFDETDLAEQPASKPSPKPPRPSPPRPNVPQTPPPAPDPEMENVVAEWQFPAGVDSVMLGSERPDPSQDTSGERFQLVADPAVSRYQARIYQKGGKYFLVHFGTNPTLTRFGNQNRVLRTRDEEIEIREGTRIEMGQTAFIFRKPAASAPPSPTPPAFRYQTIDGADLIAVLRRYTASLKNLYGANSNYVQAPLTRLYKNFPELEKVFTPDMLNQAADRSAESDLFDKFNKALQEAMSQRGVSNGLKKDIEADFEAIKKVMKPAIEPTEIEIEGLMAKYYHSLCQIVPDSALWAKPEKRAELAKSFARLYQLSPELEKTFNPDALVAMEEDARNKIFKQLMREFHSDRKKETEGDVYKSAFQAVGDIADTLGERKMNPEIAPGIWELRPKRVYVVGRNGKADISLPDGLLSSDHFKIFFDEGAWNIQDLKSTNGTFLQGFQLQTDRSHLIQNGQMVAAGNNFFAFETQADGSARLTLMRNSVQPANVGEPAPFSQSYPPGPQIHSLGREQITHDGLMSGRHMEFQMQGIIWHVRDAGSVNGTLLNLGQIASNFDPQQHKSRPPGEFYPIKSGDRIMAGMGQFEVQVGADGALTITQIPWNPAPAVQMPFAHENQFFMKSAEQVTIQTFKGDANPVEFDTSREGAYFFNVGSTMWRPKVYGIIQRVHDSIILKVENKGIEVVSQNGKMKPAKGQEVVLQEGDRVLVEGKEILLN